jgi:competence protein ComEC
MLAMVVVVVVDPWALMQAGFWLSFVAVGVLFATDAQSSAKLRTHPAMQKMASAAREQWVITLALSPLSLLLFQQVSIVGLLANALAIPWVTLVVTPLAMLGTLVHPLWDAAAWGVQGMGWVLAWLASLPFATISIAAPALWMGALGILGGMLLAMPLPLPLRAMGLPMLLPVFLYVPLRPAAGEFELIAADIGQGNAVIVRTAQHSLLYDAGPRFSRESDAGQRTLVPLLRAMGEKIDMLMLSHRDTDHIGGAQAVLAMQPQAALISSLEDGHEFLAQRSAAQTALPNPVATTQRCIAGQKWQWDGVNFEVLHPQAADYQVKNKSNAMSCVLRIATATQTALLVGDIEAAQEARLVAQFVRIEADSVGAEQLSVRAEPAEAQPGIPPNPTQTITLRADILLVPHHGSKTSSTDAFLNTVQPRIAIVQAGYRNRFNHPAPEVAQRYVDRHIQLIDSPRCGAATWSSAQPQEVMCQRQVRRRYWHHIAP